jgi:glutathione S-transferase
MKRSAPERPGGPRRTLGPSQSLGDFKKIPTPQVLIYIYVADWLFGEQKMLIFYNNRACPFCHRILLVLLELGIPFQDKPCNINAGQKEPWFTEVYQKALGANKKSDGRVPIIDDDGFILTESTVIVEYLVLKFGPRTGIILKSETPQDTALAMIFEHLHTRRFLNAFFSVLKYQSNAAVLASTTEFLRVIQAISEAFTIHKGPYLLGENLTTSDLLFYPFVARLPVLHHIRGFLVPEQEVYLPFHRFCRAMEARPTVQAAAQSTRVMLDAYMSFTDGM